MLTVGQLRGKPSLLRSTMDLCNLKNTDDEAVLRRYLDACQPRQRDYLVTLKESNHTATFIKTGGGKGRSLIQPFLRRCRESVVVVDLAGENALKAIHARRAMGKECILLDPYRVVTQYPDTFNPLDLIGEEHAIDDCRELADALVIRPPGEKEPHWSDSAVINIGTILMGVAAMATPENRNLQYARSILCDTNWREQAINDMCASPLWNGLISRMGKQLKNYQGKEANSVHTTIHRNLNFLDTTAIVESTTRSSFDIRDLLSGGLDLFLIQPPDRFKPQAATMRTWIWSALRVCVRGGFNNQNVHFLIDEAAAILPMDCVNDALDKYRKHNVKVHLFFQSMGQLKSAFPVDQGQTVLSNTDHIFTAPGDLDTGLYLNKRLGDFTLVSFSGSESIGGSEQRSPQGGSTSTSSNQTRSWQAHSRALKTPDELMRMDPRWAITFAGGARPILTWMCRYDENDFTPRRMPKWRLVLDAASLALTAAFLAFLWTAILLKQR